MTDPETPNTPWYSAENVRFGTILLAIVFATLLTRVNGCDKGQIARSILDDPSVAQLAPQQRQLLDRVNALSSRVEQLASAQQAMQGTLGAVNKQTTQLVSAAARVVYEFDPNTQEEPDPAALGRLQGLVQAGAGLQVVHRPAEGSGRSVAMVCQSSAVDTNGNVLCFGPVVPANPELPDGRRYQEVLRDDGTLTLAHWNADGSNVQGARELGKRAAIWIASTPLR